MFNSKQIHKYNTIDPPIKLIHQLIVFPHWNNHRENIPNHKCIIFTFPIIFPYYYIIEPIGRTYMLTISNEKQSDQIYNYHIFIY